jgi:tRNA A37 threonylcarbamoyltransferase TsaD
MTLRIPKPRLCTDNGAMIASFAAHLVAAGASPSPLNAPSDPGLPVVTAQVSWVAGADDATALGADTREAPGRP